MPSNKPINIADDQIKNNNKIYDLTAKNTLVMPLNINYQNQNQPNAN